MDEIPVSDALSEAHPLSLQELFSRDPENFSKRRFEELLDHIRDLRERLASTETIRQPRVRKPKDPTAVAEADPSEMGF